MAAASAEGWTRDVAVRVGANVAPGQDVVVLARAIAVPILRDDAWVLATSD